MMLRRTPQMLKKSGIKLVRQSQIVQSVIYGPDAVVTQVLMITPAVLSLGSQLDLFPFVCKGPLIFCKGEKA